jgi:hypothetical protein
MARKADGHRFAQVKKILQESVNNEKIGGHGNWWEGLSRDEFVNYEIFRQRLVNIGDADNSVVIHALTGTGMFSKPMPIDHPPVPKDRIQFIRDWINDGCPND